MPDKFSPTQLALQAIERCDKNADETRVLADAVYEHAINGAEFKGQVVECMKNQDKVLTELSKIVTTHVTDPHYDTKLGELSGQNKILILVFTSIITLLVVLLTIQTV